MDAGEPAGVRWAPWPPTALLVIAAGGACSAAWMMHASLPLIWRQALAFNWWLVLPAAALTLASIGLRFIRWQFLLRRARLVLPARPSLSIFLAGLAMLLTPAYAGEGVKAWLVGRAVPGATTRAAGAVAAERVFDAVALCLVGGLALAATGDTHTGGLLLAAGALGLLLAAGAIRAAPPLLAWLWRVRGTSAAGVRPFIVDGRGVVIALALSASAWTAGCLTLYVVCRGAGVPLGPTAAAGTYALSTLLGGLTLLPAGVGVVGTVILLRLQAGGATLQQAVLVAVLVRLVTVWLTATIGIVATGRAWLQVRGRPWAMAPLPAHFDRLAPRYDRQLSAATRERVVGRKVALTLAQLREAGIAPGARLLDAGCGPGWYVAALTRAGYRLIGLDAAHRQVLAARCALAAGTAPDSAAPASSRADRCAHGRWPASGSDPAFVTGSALALPFASGAFDAALAVNVLHHVGDARLQNRALAELGRVVRPAGLVIVHELATVNPLYRLYMTYLFPLWRQIDLGTEVWLDPRALPAVPGLQCASVAHYTFLPDFTPRRLYRLLGGLEARLERSRWARYGAHFTAVYRRTPGERPVPLPLPEREAAGTHRPLRSAGPPAVARR